MEELIYRFLLRAGFPRAAVVTDMDLLALAGDADGNGAERPSYAIVDPGTGDRLALVDVVAALDDEGLRAAADALADRARHFGGRSVQGFLVRVDPAGATTDEQVRFYRVWPTETLERVSAKAFPDLDTLRTWRLLAERRASASRGVVELGDDPDDADAAYAAAFGEGDGPSGAARSRVGPWAWLPGLALAALAVADVVAARVDGHGFLSAVQAVLLVGAAALLLAPALARRG